MMQISVRDLVLISRKGLVCLVSRGPRNLLRVSMFFVPALLYWILREKGTEVGRRGQLIVASL